MSTVGPMTDHGRGNPAQHSPDGLTSPRYPSPGWANANVGPPSRARLLAKVKDAACFFPGEVPQGPEFGRDGVLGEHSTAMCT